MAHLKLAVGDGKFTITNLFSPTEGLAPKDKGVQEDNAVVAVAPSVVDSLFNWQLTRQGITLDQKSLLATFELLGADKSSTGYYLSYDYTTSSVVIKKDSRPVWIVSQYTGGQTQYQITPLFSTGGTQYLTYSASGAQVTVATAATGNDVPKQVWNIAN